MARPDQEIVDQFQKDKGLLPYDDGELAKKMQLDPGNFSKNVNKTTSKKFLKNFYNVFSAELKKIKEQLNYNKQGNIDPDILAHMESRIMKRIDKLEETLSQMSIEYAKQMERLILSISVEKNKDLLTDAINNAVKQHFENRAVEKRLNKKPAKKSPLKKSPPKKRKPK